MEGKNKSFVEVFGERAVLAQIGEWTLYPDGTLKRVNHPDSRYGEVKDLREQGRISVSDPSGRPIILEYTSCVRVQWETTVEQQESSGQGGEGQAPEDGTGQAPAGGEAQAPTETTQQQ